MTERKPITLTAAADCPNCKGTGWHVDVAEALNFTDGRRIYNRPRSEWAGLCSCLRPAKSP